MQFRSRSVHPYRRDDLPSDKFAILPRRSALILRGAVLRYRMHGIDRAANARRRTAHVSATFWTLPDNPFRSSRTAVALAARPPAAAGQHECGADPWLTARVPGKFLARTCKAQDRWSST